jgi:hypothetical protein
MNWNSLIIKVAQTHTHSTLNTNIRELTFFSNTINFNKTNIYSSQKNLSKLQRRGKNPGNNFESLILNYKWRYVVFLSNADSLWPNITEKAFLQKAF